MDEYEQQKAGLPEAFGQSAAFSAHVETVSLPIDADVVAWLKTEVPDWEAHVNGLLRFYMDTSAERARSFDPDAFEPGEMVQDPPPQLEWA